MKAERWAILESIVSAALDLEPSLRADFLRSTCTADPDLLAEALSLIEQDTDPGFLNPVLNHNLPDPWIGCLLGPYRVVSRIGAGGMGAVYRAVREDGQFEQTVAIKVLGDAHSTALRHRFELERHILARLFHPGIASLLDSGISPTGAPYLVMEFVDGQPLRNAIQSLNLHQSLQLFRQVCSAVQYAHQNLVIHRDIKPANIIVTPSGQPKLLDFGIAKLQHDSSPQTATILRAMTLNYASPEQIQGKSLTTASDIYSLGLLLYEVAYRQPARNLASRTLNEIIVISTSSVPRKDRSFGDLDAIIDKALEPDPALRYSSAAALAADIERYETSQPVEARPPSIVYTSTKFFKRHKLSVLASIAAILLLLTAVITLTIQTRRLTAARDLAEQRRSETEHERKLAIDAQQQALKDRKLADQATANALAQTAIARNNFEDLRKLSGAVLFEFNDGIRNLPGTLEVRQKMVTRSTEYLEKLSRYAKDNPTNASIWHELGESYLRLALLQGGTNNANFGNTEAKFRNLAASEAAFRKWLVLNPKDPTARLRFAEAQLTAYYEFRQSNRLADAMQRLDSATSLLAPYLSRSNEDERTRRILANHAFAQAFASTDLSSQLAAWSRCRQHYLWLLERKPTDLDLLRNLGLTHKYESVLLRKSDKPEALRHLAKARDYDEQRLRLAPLDGVAKLDLSYDLTNFGDLETNHSAALAFHQQAATLRRELHQADPKDQLASQRLAQALAKVAHRGFQASQYAVSKAAALESEKILSGLPPSASNLNTNEFRSRSLWALGHVYLLESDQPDACDSFRKAAALAIVESLQSDLAACPQSR